MNLKDLQNISPRLIRLRRKKIALLGLGMENYALLKYLLQHKVKGEITICDARVGAMRASPLWALRAMPLRKNIHWQLGKNFKDGLEKFDILFRSPGWPIDCPGIKQAQSKKSPPPPFAKGGLSSPIKLFFDLCPTKNIIGITGTKGKGTTASLIYEILKTAGKKVWLGGNIGIAPFDFMDKIKKNDWVVLELSSFQLEDMTVSPHLAVVTNFYPEHLAAADPYNPNYHKTLYDYFKAKWNIARWQKKEDYLFLNSKFPLDSVRGRQITKQLKGKIINFKKSDLPSKLVGGHNQENIAAAVEVARILGVKPGIIKKAVANFKGLKHRLELVRIIKGVKYYDDSFATTPEATITALKSFAQPIVLLLGGAEKNSDFRKLVREVKRKVKFVVLLKGEATPRLKKELFKIKFPVDKVRLVSSMKEAVKQAQKNSAKGNVVLLSTACASFGMFRNYKERGDLFNQEVRRLIPLETHTPSHQRIL